MKTFYALKLKNTESFFSFEYGISMLNFYSHYSREVIEHLKNTIENGASFDIVKIVKPDLDGLNFYGYGADKVYIDEFNFNKLGN